ncbi:MAG: hypothetical protein U0Y82_15550 [Thermoleophilia bacterium]
MNAADLVAAHGSPLWMADVTGVPRAHAELRATLAKAWDDVAVAYSYKTNRLGVFLRALARDGALAEVVCDAEYLLAREVAGHTGPDIVVNGPAKSDRLLGWAGRDDALVLLDGPDEVDRARRAGVRRVGVRVAVPGALGATSRFGIPPDQVVPTAVRARAAGLRVEALSMHVVSTDLDDAVDPSAPLASRVRIRWPRGPDDHAAGAALLGRLAAEAGRRGVGIGTVDVGGGLPAPPDADEHAHAIGRALADAGFRGRLMVEPGRALVSQAVELATTVVAVKRLTDGRRALIVDAGTNLLPGALWAWPAIRTAIPPTDGTLLEPALVSGPLCLNTDVLHPAAALPADLRPGDVLVVSAAGAYQQVQSTQFGDLRPAVVARDDGTWRLARSRETLDELRAAEDVGVHTGSGSQRQEDS